MYNPDGLKIITKNDPTLRQKSKKISDVGDPKIQDTIKNMIKTLKLNNGIGLAAPQIGKLIRLFVIELDYKLYVIINPEIKHISKDRIAMEEGCLSFPGIFYQIIRNKKITIKYIDQFGQKQTLKAKGILARAIQHEIDHLDGVLFIDKKDAK
ncbi:MAG: peptide deformylase [Candidatus Moranbacteria bacterium]|nr:peptide deformylase [Candidatus Moranbacteria bacterium]